VAKLSEIQLGRPMQIAAYRHARRVLWDRYKRLKASGGIILADGVGLGKTYEALATAATLLSLRQHGKQRKQQRPYHVLILVPPRLITKWEDELRLPDKWPKYIAPWQTPATSAVYQTFSRPIVLRKMADLSARRARFYRRHEELPPGLYLANLNLLSQAGRKAGQLHRTPWDVVMVDEAHHPNNKLTRLPPHTLLARQKTAAILLTATPFQLSPKDMHGLLEVTFGGYGGAASWGKADEGAGRLYRDPAFKEYRTALLRYFKNRGDREAVTQAIAQRDAVETLLRDRIVRNHRKESRTYFLVDGVGRPHAVSDHLFRLDETRLAEILRSDALVDLDDPAREAYLAVRNHLAKQTAGGARPFVAGVLRQLLSTYGQFQRSSFGRAAHLDLPAEERHPKLAAASALVDRLIAAELARAVEQGWIGKILIFTTYVGAESGEEMPSAMNAHGTAATLKKILQSRVERLLPRPSRKLRLLVRARLVARLGPTDGLNTAERQAVKTVIGRFAGSRAAAVVFRDPKGNSQGSRNLTREARALGRMLAEIRAVNELVKTAAADEETEDAGFRAEKQRDGLFNHLLDRYSTRDLVARYDGAVDYQARDRHLRGFNSPFAPLVLIASSVGQEGIDLQTYCQHVVHYDLEWNPAKIEQREGRVDRLGRARKDPVNVYFLLCKGTYDERVLHVMVNRFRWHQVLLATRSRLETDPSRYQEGGISEAMVRKLALDLRPPRVHRG
jgi:hypothetical protein